MKILVLAEHDNQQLKEATYHALAAAKELGTDITLLIIGHQCKGVANDAALLAAVQTVMVADHAVYAHQLAENTAALIASVSQAYDYLMAAASTATKNILPRVAALLDVAMVSDVVKIVAPDTFVRPIYAGNALATVQSHDARKVLTIRMSAFPAAHEKKTTAASITEITTVIENTVAKFESQQLTPATRPELTSAHIVVAGGRGLKSAESFQLLTTLADRLGAALGASRAAVDAGFAPNDYQVGQTGKVVAPELYIAVGISGAIQHVAGMKESKIIVAINNDPDAPIFDIADYGLVGDLFKILPDLEKELDKME